MAKQQLPTNYVDDVLNASMNGKRQYNMQQNANGTVSLVEVTVLDKIGSTFSAGNINATNKAVNQSADSAKIIDSLDDIEANTQPGMLTGALATKELTSNLLWKLAGSVTGTAVLSLPSSYSEVYIEVRRNTGTIWSFLIPSIALTDTYRDYRGGYAAASADLAGLSLYVRVSDAKLNVFKGNGTDVSRESTVTAWYR